MRPRRFLYDCGMTAGQLRVLATAILGSSLVFADGSIVTVAIPKLREALGASLGQMQWVANSYTLVLASFLLLGGAAGDRYGLNRVFAAGVALFALASCGCALAASAPQLIFARAIQGLGGAALVPGSLALLAAHFPPDKRGGAIGAWAASTSIAAALGPLLGGWLIDHAPWQSIFFINLPLAAVAIALTVFGVDDPPGVGRKSMDWPGAMLAVAGLGALTLGLTLLGQPQDAALSTALWICASGAALLGVFLGWEAKAAAPMMPLAPFRSKSYAGVNALTLLLYFALAGVIFFLPTTLIEAHGWSAAKAGSIFLGFTTMLAIVSRFGGGAADRYGLRLPLTLGPALTALGLGLLGPAAANGDYWLAITPVMLLIGLGMGVTVAPLSTAVMNAAPPGHSGIASATNNAVARVAGLFAVASLGVIASWGFRLAAQSSGLDTRLRAALLDAGFGQMPQALGDATATEALRAGYAQATLWGFIALTILCAAIAALSALVGFATQGAATQGAGKSV